MRHFLRSRQAVKRAFVNNYRAVTATRYATQKTTRGECNQPRLDAAQAKKLMPSISGDFRNVNTHELGFYECQPWKRGKKTMQK